MLYTLLRIYAGHADKAHDDRAWLCTNRVCVSVNGLQLAPLTLLAVSTAAAPLSLPALELFPFEPSLGKSGDTTSSFADQTLNLHIAIQPVV